MLHLLMDSGSSPTNLEGTRRVDELRILTSKYVSINLKKSQVSKTIDFRDLGLRSLLYIYVIFGNLHFLSYFFCQIN